MSNNKVQDMECLTFRRNILMGLYLVELLRTLVFFLFLFALFPLPSSVPPLPLLIFVHFPLIDLNYKIEK